MPEPLGLEAIRGRLAIAKAGITSARILDSCHVNLVKSANDVTALVAEVERLWATYDPLGRLEMWRRATPAFRVSLSYAGRDILCVLRDELNGTQAMCDAVSIPVAIGLAIDAWDAKYGKDAPHA